MIKAVQTARNDSRHDESCPANFRRLFRGGRLIKGKRGIVSFAASVLLLCASTVIPTYAGTAPFLTWEGGSGTWDTSSPVWLKGGFAGTYVPWDNGTDVGGVQPQYEQAVFSGTGGTISIVPGQTMIVSSLILEGDYTLSGGQIQLSNGDPRYADSVSKQSYIGVSAGHTATISSVLTGIQGAQISADHLLVLSANNTYQGATTVLSGTLQLGNGGTSGTAGETNNVTVNSAATLVVDRSDDLLVALDNKGTFRQAGAGSTTFNHATGRGAGYIDSGSVIFSGTDPVIDDVATWHLNGGTLHVESNSNFKTIYADAANSVINVDANITAGDNYSISGNGTLVKQGDGTFVVGGNITTDGVSINGGTLVIGETGSTSNGHIATTVTDNGTLEFQSNELNPTRSSATGVIDGTGNMKIAGTGVTILSADNTYGGGTTIATGGTLRLGFGGTTGSVDGTIANNGTLTFEHSSDFTLVNDISGTGQLVIDGQHTFTITGNNTYSGGTTVRDTTLVMGADTALGAVNGKLGLTDSQLKLTDDFTSARTFELSGQTDTLYSDFDVTLTGKLSGTAALEKAGSGTLTLTGDSTGYAQTISVNDGGLIVDGKTSASIDAGSGTFVSGSGHVGNLTIEDNASLRGQAGQTLYAQSIMLSDHSATDVTLGSPSDAALFSTSGKLQLGGTLNIVDGGGFSAGVYRLFDYGGSLSGTMTIGDVPTNADRDRMTIQTNQPGQVNLINSTGVTLSFWDGSDPHNYNNGIADGGNGIWNAADAFWTDGQGSQNGNWGQGAFAVFGGAKGNVTIDNSDGDVKAGGMQFITDGYVLDGDPLDLDNGSTTPIITVGDHSANSASMTATINSVLTGSHGMEKTDAGRLVLTADNTYTGTTLVDGGVLQLGDDTASGSVIGDIAIAKGAQVEIRHSNGITLASQISGDGTVLQNGAGETTFAADNSFSGGLTVRKGSARAGIDDHSFGSGLLTVGQDGTAALDGHNTTVGGLSGAGKVHLDNATLTLNEDINTLFSGTLDGTGGLTKDGSGLLELSGTNSYSGKTALSSGEIKQTGQGAISASSGFDISDKAILDLGGFNTQMSGLTNAGVVQVGGTGGTILDIAGNYHGADGTFIISTVLDGDNSTTDMIKVEGDTSGSTNLKVVNRGGLGAQTVNGIEVVDVAGQSDGAFSLMGDFTTKDGQQAVIGGAYAYTLHQGGITDPNDGDWYLRSGLKDPVTPPSPDNPTDPLYSPTAPVYEGVVNNMQALNRLPTLRERVGDRYNRDDPEALFDLSQYGGNQDGDNAVDSSRAIWARMEGGYNSLQPATTTGHVRQGINQMRYQIGADGKLYEGDDGALYFGVSGEYGTAHSKMSSSVGHGTVDTDGWGMHGTLTWYGSDGFYVDAQAQATWYRNDLFSNTANSSIADGKHGFGYAMSLETGKQFDLDETWSLTPQAQLMWSSVRMNAFTDAYQSRVSLDNGNSLSLRMGLSADYRNAWTTVAGTPMKADLYGIMNVYQDFQGDASIMVSDTALKTRNDKTWGGIGWGGNLAWDDQYAIYGQGTLNTSLSHFGDSYSLAGTIGFRKWW